MTDRPVRLASDRREWSASHEATRRVSLEIRRPRQGNRRESVRIRLRGRSAVLTALLPAAMFVIACADDASRFKPEQVNEIVYRHIYDEATSGKLYSPCGGRIYASARYLGRGDWEVGIRCRQGNEAPLSRVYGFDEGTGEVSLILRGTPVAEPTAAAPTAAPTAPR